jgi:hypothetical protein
MSHPSSSGHRRNGSEGPRPQPMDIEDPTPFPTQTTITASQQAFQQDVNAKVLSDLIARMSRCNSFGELLKTVPAPAQETTKHILEKVIDSFTRQGACETLKASWQDFLNKREYERVPELNSLKAPSVQISKIAKEVDEVAINALNFDNIMQDVRNAALVQMIGIKQQEIINLKKLCDENSVRTTLMRAWSPIATSAGITPEHATILTHKGCAERLVQMAISIGQNSLTRSATIKQKKLEKRAEADVDMTDIQGNPKNFEAMFNRMFEKKQQSERDRRNSGKGKGRAGPPRKQNQKPGPTKVQKKKKGAKTNAKKPATSTARQQRRR